LPFRLRLLAVRAAARQQVATRRLCRDKKTHKTLTTLVVNLWFVVRGSLSAGTQKCVCGTPGLADARAGRRWSSQWVFGATRPAHKPTPPDTAVRVSQPTGGSRRRYWHTLRWMWSTNTSRPVTRTTSQATGKSRSRPASKPTWKHTNWYGKHERQGGTVYGR